MNCTGLDWDDLKTQRKHFSLALKIIGGLILFTFIVQWSIFFLAARLNSGQNAAKRQTIMYTKDLMIVPKNVANLNLKVTLATVVCGEKHLDLASNMLKSAILFSLDVNLHIIIFTDEDTIFELNNVLINLRQSARRHFSTSHFTYELRYLSFPSVARSGIDWKGMHLKCTNERLFFPRLLPHIDAVIYLDTDTLVFGSLGEMWLEFDKMSEEQLAGASQNGEFLHFSMYNKYKGHPYYGPRGLNAGVMLMNLTRMRWRHTRSRSIEIFKNYGEIITYADQDILNILFAETPSQMYTMSCIFNFLWVHCPWKVFENEGRNRCIWTQAKEPICFCNDIYKRGVYILHGNSGSFLKNIANTTDSMFPWIYSIFDKYQFGDSLDAFLTKIAEEYDEYQCFMNRHHLIRNALNYFTKLSLF